MTHHRFKFGGWVSFVAVVVAAAHCSAGDGDLRQRVERIADELPWLNVGDVIFHREARAGSGPDVTRVNELLRQLRKPAPADPERLRRLWRVGLALGWDPDEIRPLLDHDDPRVGTLGIAMLYDLNRLDVLPDIALLIRDEQETFPAPFGSSRMGQPQRWSMQSRTVGQYARAAIERYVAASAELQHLRGRLGAMEPEELSRIMREFAAARDPEYSTASLVVAMERAMGGMHPWQFMEANRAERVQAVLGLLRDIDEPRRFFVMVRLDFDRYRGERYAPTYLLSHARRVPREMRLAALRGERVIDDPDLPPGFGSGYFLNHAVDLLRAEASPLIAPGAWASAAAWWRRRGCDRTRRLRSWFPRSSGSSMSWMAITGCTSRSR